MDSKPYYDLLRLAVTSLDDASRVGVPLRTGERLYPICLGVKGDWPFLVPANNYFYHCKAFFVCFILKLVGIFLGINHAFSSILRESFWHECKPFEVSSAQITRSYRNVPKRETSKSDCTGICHICLAGRPGLDFEYMNLWLHYFTSCAVFCLVCVWGENNMHVQKGTLNFSEPLPHLDPCLPFRRDDAPFLATMHVEDPWDSEPVFTEHLFHDPTQKSAFYKIDLFHTVTLGIGKSYAASCGAVLQELCHGSTIEERIKDFSCLYIEYCKDTWRQNTAVAFSYSFHSHYDRNCIRYLVPWSLVEHNIFRGSSSK